MKAWFLDHPGSIDGLVMRERTTAAPEGRAVQIRVRALSLNYRDNIVVAGRYPAPIPPGRIPLSDCAGEVIAVGPQVTRFKPGDRVSASFHQAWIAGDLSPEVLGADLGGGIDGVAAQELLLEESGLVKLAPHLSFEEGATLPCAGVTAWRSLMSGRRPLQAGETLLVQGTGGVALFAAQLGLMAGARVIAITSSDAKAEKLEALGVHGIINYTETPDWAARTLEMTSGRGVDRIVETGGPTTFEQSLRAVRAGGTISVVGAAGGPQGPALSSRMLLGRGICIDSVLVGSRADFEALLRAVHTRHLQPVIDRVFAFAELPDALRYLASQRHIGKVVVSAD